MILTVGAGARGMAPGLAQGLVQTIQRRRPDRFLLVPSRSRDSQAVAALVLKGLDKAARASFVPWQEDRPYLSIDQHDNLECVRATVREAIRGVRERFPHDAVVLQPGSGTRQMSAGATLAALDEGVGQIEFSAGGRADAEGKAAAVAAFDAARWRADHDVVLAGGLWDKGMFAAAAEVVRAAAGHLAAAGGPRKQWLGLAHAADGFGSKDACQFAEAEKQFRESLKLLPADAGEAATACHGLHHACKESADRCARFAKAQGSERQAVVQRELVAELVDNSLRAARVERFDEAASRLLRAMEMELQIRLAEATGGDFWNGRLVKARKAPEALRTAAFLAQIQHTELPRELTVEQIVHALHALGDTATADLWRDLTDFRRPSEWRQAVTVATASVMVRGWTPVEKADYKNLRRVANRFLQMNLGETHSVPAFDRRWLA